MTVRASASGKFDTEYPKMSDEVARFRRLITRDMIRRSPKVDLDALANQTTAPSSVAVKPTSAGTLRIKDFLKVAKKTPEA